MRNSAVFRRARYVVLIVSRGDRHCPMLAPHARLVSMFSEKIALLGILASKVGINNIGSRPLHMAVVVSVT